MTAQAASEAASGFASGNSAGAGWGSSPADFSLDPGVLSSWGLWAKKHTLRVQLRPSLQGCVRYLHARAGVDETVCAVHAETPL